MELCGSRDGAGVGLEGSSVKGMELCGGREVFSLHSGCLAINNASTAQLGPQEASLLMHYTFQRRSVRKTVLIPSFCHPFPIKTHSSHGLGL